MAKKLLETSLGPWDQTFFSLNGRRVTDEEAIKKIKGESNPYVTSSDGVLVYLTDKEYSQVKGELRLP